jgi:hypothetical protein
MNAERFLPKRDYDRLADATHRLVNHEKVGGPSRAASEYTRSDPARLSRYGSRHERMRAPVDIIADLEAAAGEPVVTTILADLQGFHLVPKCGAGQSVDFTRHLGAVAKETGEAVSALAVAIADGEVTPQEAQDCIAEAEDAQRRLACLIDDLKGIAAKAPVQLRRQA